MKKLFLLCTLAAVALVGCEKTHTGEDSDPGTPAATYTPKTTDPGVEINGIKWATCNVHWPKTFTVRETDPGMYYQWNRITGWTNDGYLLVAYGTDGKVIPGRLWDNTDAEGYNWAAANDPCPTGWRMPTSEEFDKLCDEEKVTSEWIPATQTVLSGRKFTDNNNKNTVFFPATGIRYAFAGALGFVGSNGYYWSVTLNSADYGYILGFSSANTNSTGYNSRGSGFSARCVAE